MATIQKLHLSVGRQPHENTSMNSVQIIFDANCLVFLLQVKLKGLIFFLLLISHAGTETESVFPPHCITGVLFLIFGTKLLQSNLQVANYEDVSHTPIEL